MSRTFTVFSAPSPTLKDFANAQSLYATDDEVPDWGITLGTAEIVRAYVVDEHALEFTYTTDWGAEFRIKVAHLVRTAMILDTGTALLSAVGFDCVQGFSVDDIPIRPWEDALCIAGNPNFIEHPAGKFKCPAMYVQLTAEKPKKLDVHQYTLAPKGLFLYPFVIDVLANG